MELPAVSPTITDSETSVLKNILGNKTDKPEEIKKEELSKSNENEKVVVALNTYKDEIAKFKKNKSDAEKIEDETKRKIELAKLEGKEPEIINNLGIVVGGYVKSLNKKVSKENENDLVKEVNNLQIDLGKDPDSIRACATSCAGGIIDIEKKGFKKLAEALRSKFRL